MTDNSQLKNLIQLFHAQQPVRSGSMIITVFGDVIAPHGGQIWLGSLINVMELLGLNERLVRTTVSRLAKRNWLDSNQIGRKSNYHLTEYGLHSFASATSRIYAGGLYSGSAKIWDEKWHMVILPAYVKDKKSQKDQLRKELKWLSFGAVTNNIFIHPNPDLSRIRHVLKELNLQNDVMIGSDSTFETPQNTLVKECWPLDALAQQYQDFIDIYQPILENLSPATAQDSFLIRILMMNSYRKISLQDPLLPSRLLPADWTGTIAYNLCRELYILLLKPSEVFITSQLKTATGNLPPLSSEFYSRFGGIETIPS